MTDTVNRHGQSRTEKKAMGMGPSRRGAPSVPPPRYSPPPPGNAFPTYPYNSASGYPSNLSAKEQRKLADAYRTIRNFQRPMYGMQRGSNIGQPSPPPSPSFRNPPIMNVSQPSPVLQRAYGQYPPSYGSIGYRDTDYAAVANISGLNPADIATLHREYVNLTRGGRNKLDRVVFRQLLRDVLIDANNENIDRALENIFVSIDRNHDGFIDFPEFIGAFRDILKADPSYHQPTPVPYSLQELLNEQMKSNTICTPAICQPLSYVQQSQPTAQVISIPSAGFTPQGATVYNGPAPLVLSLDANQSSFGTTIQGQPSNLQCLPLPM